jgi:hypothetical protein
MGLFMKWGNWAVAKLTEILFSTTQFTDVGCTYRLIKKSTLKKIERKFTITGNEFNLDMMLQVIKSKLKFIEIPVNYLKRVGESSVTGSRYKAFKVGIKMIFIIILNKFKK